MTLQSSGQISLQQIAQEFGDTAPHGISELYNEDEGVPASGVVSFSTFHGKRDTVELTIPSNQENLNLHTYATAAGWSNGKHLKVTIPSGVYIYNSAESGTALTCCPATEQGFEAGTRVDIINNGYIVGGYGAGASGATGQAVSASGSVGDNGTNGTLGGDAILVSPSGNDITMDLTITNNGTIAGGGGGGGSGGGGSKEVVITSSAAGESYYYSGSVARKNYIQVITGSAYSSSSAAQNANPYKAEFYLDYNGSPQWAMSMDQTSWTVPTGNLGPTSTIASSYRSSNRNYADYYWAYGYLQESIIVSAYNSFTMSTTYQRKDYYRPRIGSMQAGVNSGNAGRGAYYDGSTLQSAGSGSASSGSGNRASGASGDGGALGASGVSGNASAGGATGGTGGAAGHYYKKNASISGSGAFTFVNNGTASGLFA